MANELPRSRTRFHILLLACSLSMLTYLDRVCFGTAASDIVRELHLTSEADLKWAFTAFAIAYALFEIPSGWWGDRFGPKQVLLRVVLWWSFFTAMTGCVGLQVWGVVIGGLGTLIVVRFLFGMGEAGAYPNLARALQNWFPIQERGKALGWVWMSGRLMGGLTPIIWVFLVSGSSLLSWRQAFWLFGLLGIFWCIWFRYAFRNLPSEHPQVNQKEKEWIESSRREDQHSDKIPWKAILFSRSLVCLYLMYFLITYGWYFNITYLPKCLETWFGLDPQSTLGAVYKGGPLWLGALGCILGGYLTDYLLRRTSRRWARRIPGIFGLSLCSICYALASFMETAWAFALTIALAAFLNDLMMGSAWSTCQDIGGKHTGIVAGVMNTAGSLGAAIAAYLSGVVLEYYLETKAGVMGITIENLPPNEKTVALIEGYQTNLWIFAGTTLLAVFCWLGVNAEKSLQSKHDTDKS